MRINEGWCANIAQPIIKRKATLNVCLDYKSWFHDQQVGLQIHKVFCLIVGLFNHKLIGGARTWRVVWGCCGR